MSMRPGRKQKEDKQDLKKHICSCGDVRGYVLLYARDQWDHLDIYLISKSRIAIGNTDQEKSITTIKVSFVGIYVNVASIEAFDMLT